MAVSMMVPSGVMWKTSDPVYNCGPFVLCVRVLWTSIALASDVQWLLASFPALW